MLANTSPPQLFAKGGEDGPEYNRAHRLINAWEFAKLARQAAELGRYVIAVCFRLFLYVKLLMSVYRQATSIAFQPLYR